jgi:DNA-binding transcriptional regulator PaaX
MQPFERFKISTTQGNLWIYLISLAKDQTICDDEARRMIFEKFGFLPNDLSIRNVIFKLKRDGYIKPEKFKGKRAFSATNKGLMEVDKMKVFIRDSLFPKI